MTWEDVQIFTLQKMFAITGDTLEENTTTIPYIKSMPQVANEALRLLCTSGKYITKSYVIEQDGLGVGAVAKYDFSVLVPDFYSFGSNKVFLEAEDEYRPTTDYLVEGKNIIVLRSKQSGKWTVYYNAYPQDIKKDTPGATELTLDPEVAVLLPLYMASQLYKDDDTGLATQWRNEFEVAKEQLLPNATPGTIEFDSTWGW